MPVRQAAATFRVSIAYIYKALVRRRMTGDAGINPHRGRAPRNCQASRTWRWRRTSAPNPGSRWRKLGHGCWPSMRWSSASERHGMRLGVWACRSKQTLRAAEQDRPDVAARRKLWKAAQPFLDPESLVFPHEAGVNTKIARLYGGRRLASAAVTRYRSSIGRR